MKILLKLEPEMKNIIFMHFQSSQISSLLKVNFSHHCCFAEAADK